jgi:hypothetical protein
VDDSVAVTTVKDVLAASVQDAVKTRAGLLVDAHMIQVFTKEVWEAKTEWESKAGHGSGCPHGPLKPTDIVPAGVSQQNYLVVLVPAGTCVVLPCCCCCCSSVHVLLLP